MTVSARPTFARRTALVTLVLVTLQQVGLTLVRFGLPAIAPFIRTDLGLSIAQVGLLLALADTGAVVSYVPTGLAADRWSERRVLTAGAMLMAAATLAAAAAPSYALLALALALGGIGFPSGHTAGSKTILREFPPHARGFAIGIRQAGLPVGGALAALLVPPLASAGGWRLALAGVGAGCGLFGLICLLLPAQPPHAEPAAGGSALVALLRDSGFRTITAMATALVVGQFTLQGFLPLFLVDRHAFPAQVAAATLALVHAGGVAGRLVWGWLSDRAAAGRRAPVLHGVVPGGLAVLIALALLPAGAPRTLLAGLALLGGAALAGWNGLAIALLLERAGAQRAATAVGLSLTVLYVGTMAGVSAFGWVVDATGSYAAAWALVAAVQSLAWLILTRVREAGPLPGPASRAARPARP